MRPPRSWSPSTADGRRPLAGAGSELTPFWRAVRQCSQRALNEGALQPISTRASYIPDHGVEFVVRVSDNLVRKQQAPGAYHQPGGHNPFLPPDPGLTVCGLPPHHVAVLNKFNVLDHHVLVVTRGFVHQESPLTHADFSAVAVGLQDSSGLAFYNAGKTAGASQPHRHFQLVPRSLGRANDVPTAVLFDDAAHGVNTVAGLCFQHAFSRLDTNPEVPTAFGRQCLDIYERSLRDLGIIDTPWHDEEVRLPPYNLLLTDQWLLIVPRAAERYLDVSVNGLGYGGSLFVSSAEKLAQVKAAGPMAFLERVSKPLD